MHPLTINWKEFFRILFGKATYRQFYSIDEMRDSGMKGFILGVGAVMIILVANVLVR